MRKGGAYKVAKKGAKPQLVEQTKNHEWGNRPRDKEGNALNVEVDPDADRKASVKKTAVKKGAKS